MSSVTVDSKHRVVLEKRVRAIAGIKKGDALVAIAFRGGVILASSEGKRFVESLRGFRYVEGKHEASGYLKKLAKTDADT